MSERRRTSLLCSFSHRDVRKIADVAEQFITASEGPFFLMVNYPDAHLPFLRQQKGIPKSPLDAGDVKPRQQVAAVERERRLPVPGGQRPAERYGVAPYHFEVDPDFIASPGDHDLGAERPAQDVERLTEGRTGVRLVRVRPEQGQETVPADHPVAAFETEVREEGEPLRPREDGIELLPLAVVQVDSA